MITRRLITPLAIRLGIFLFKYFEVRARMIIFAHISTNENEMDYNN